MRSIPAGCPSFVSKAALASDYQVLINWIKPHTKFKGNCVRILCKTMTIGLEKEGAAAFHQYAVDHGFGIIEEAARMLLKHLNLLFGVGLLENSAGRLAELAALTPDHLIVREKRLLRKAARMMGHIPFDLLDGSGSLIISGKIFPASAWTPTLPAGTRIL
ncbi:MAG: hypothetical protein R2874_01695 [Desulfobacterales bacterium]